MEYSQRELRDIISQFVIYGDFLVAVPFGNGNVNDTYQITYDQGGVRLHYTLQRINHQVIVLGCSINDLNFATMNQSCFHNTANTFILSSLR